jgi:hypothetical protein
VWYEEYYTKNPTNPRLRTHRDNPLNGSLVSVEEALEAIRRIHLRELVAAGLEPDEQHEDFDPDASLALPSVQVRPLPTPPPANAQVRALPVPAPANAQVRALPIPPPANPNQAPIRRITPQVEAEPIMPTTFPSEIKIKNIVKFKGDSQRLSALDISIYDLCDGNNYPAYYGGTVTGSISTEYVYCNSATVGSTDNYTFGRRFCSKIVSKFEGDAKLWWEDYIQSGGKRPNSWKSAVLNEVEGSKPDRIVEVSLFDLLSAEFPAENVALARRRAIRFKFHHAMRQAVVQPCTPIRSVSIGLKRDISNGTAGLRPGMWLMVPFVLRVLQVPTWAPECRPGSLIASCRGFSAAEIAQVSVTHRRGVRPPTIHPPA